MVFVLQLREKRNNQINKQTVTKLTKRSFKKQNKNNNNKKKQLQNTFYIIKLKFSENHY